jgi:hypothetical protein
MPEANDAWIVLLVVGARLLVPLAIPKFPLPTSIAAVVSDYLDGTVYEAFAHVGLTDYQGYDKALDVYYLSIQYLSTMRNWVNLVAFNLGRLLYYYRLAGGFLFELTQVRALFLFFPNTFEYFFLFYEAVRLRWNPKRLSSTLLIGAVFALWVLIKIPQEYWIHIAQLDIRGVKEEILRVPADTGWLAIIGQRLTLFLALAAVAVAVIVAIRWFIGHDLPPADWPLSFNADAHGSEMSADEVLAVRKVGARSLFDAELLEKTALVSIVTIIFSRLLPSMRGELLPTAFAVTIVIVVDTAISEWLIRQGVPWRSIFVQFTVMSTANVLIAAGFWLVLPLGSGQVDVTATLFSLLLVTLLVTLHDRYRPISLARQRRAHPIEQE